MIAMSVGDEDVRDRFAPKRTAQRLNMHGIVGSGIDHGDAAATDDEHARALESEGARVLREQAPDIRRDLDQLLVWHVEIALERDRRRAPCTSPSHLRSAS